MSLYLRVNPEWNATQERQVGEETTTVLRHALLPLPVIDFPRGVCVADVTIQPTATILHRFQLWKL